MLRRSIFALAEFLAITGGAVLIAVSLMTVLSIIGRTGAVPGTNAIPGDFEMVEMGIGFAVFSFLPWCQLTRAHASVEILAPFFSPAVNRTIDICVSALMTLVVVVLTWRLFEGMVSKRAYSETTYILQIPVWWGFAAAFLGMLVASIVSIYTLFASIFGEETVSNDKGLIHE